MPRVLKDKNLMWFLRGGHMATSGSLDEIDGWIDLPLVWGTSRFGPLPFSLQLATVEIGLYIKLEAEGLQAFSPLQSLVLLPQAFTPMAFTALPPFSAVTL